MARDDGDRAQRTPGGAPPTLWGRARARRRRFLDRYERRREERLAGRHHPLKRPIRVTSGVVLILAGVAIGWLPGPGFVILAFPGSLLIASEWRRAALAMDRLEEETLPRLRRLHARLRGGPKPEWVAEDPELWGLWCDRRGYGAPDTGERRRADDRDRDRGTLEPEPEEQSA
jgi:hypothetical protein